MKKQYHEIDVQASASPQQLRISIKNNDTLISNLRSSIKKKRQQMKQFSEQMTKILQKKLIPKSESIYKHPNFAPQFDNQHLQQLYNQKQKIYVEINELKYKISQLSAKEEPEVVDEIRRKEGIIQTLNKQYSKILKEHQLIEETLQKNKQRLQQYKESQCIKQIQQNEQQLKKMKLEIKQLDKELKVWVDQQIKINIYQEKAIKNMQQMENMPTQIQIQQKQFQQLIQQINQIFQERKLIDRQYITKKEEINKKIKEMTHLNSELQKNIRQKTSIHLKQQLQKKKQTILSKNKSMPQITKQKKPQNRQSIQSLIKQKQQYLPSLLLTQPPQRKKQQKIITKSLQIIIGTWIPQNHIQDDIIKSRDIVRAIAIRLKTRQKKITAIGVTYIDKMGVQVMGKSNIWKLQQGKLQQGQNQYKIDLQDVDYIFYFNPLIKKNDNGQSAIPIGLKFIMKNSKQQIKLGQFLNQQEIEKIDFDQNVIKAVQFTLDNNLKSISGIRVTLNKIKDEDNHIRKLQIEKQSIDILQKQIKKQNGIQQLMPSKWLATASEAGLTQKKVFLKSPGHKKYLSQIPQVDHRLMLNRKKKMV